VLSHHNSPVNTESDALYLIRPDGYVALADPEEPRKSTPKCGKGSLAAEWSPGTKGYRRAAQ